MTQPTPPFKIAKHERNAPLWLALKAHYTERLASLRVQNDARGKSEADTEFLRGQIAECKAFLALDTDPPTVET